MENLGNHINLSKEIKDIFINNSIEEACRKLLSITDSSELDNLIEKDDNKIAELFDLAVRYLDKDFEDQKPEIENKIVKLIS